MKQFRKSYQIKLFITLACFLIGFACFAVPSIAAGPAVAIEPAKGAKGTTITLKGSGFQPEEEIDIVLILGPGQRIGLGTVKVDIITADQAGTFEVESAIPVFAQPGQYNVEIEGSKGSQAQAQLEVTP